MTFDWNEWAWPLAVLAVGAVVGLVAGVMSRRAGEAKIVVAEGHRADLVAQHEAIVQAVRELDLEQAKLAPEVYQAQRSVLIAQGAAALRALDGPIATEVVDLGLSDGFRAALATERERLGAEAFERALATTGVRARPPAVGIAPEWRGALYAFGVVALIGALAVSANQASAPRRGGSMTGNTQAAAPQPSAREAEKQALLARVAETPTDIEAYNKLTILSLSNRDAKSAMEFNTKALAIDPKNADARVQRAALDSAVGMDAAALDLLDEVLAEHPDHAMGHLYKGMIALGVDRPVEAAEALEKAIALGVDGPMIQQALADAKAAASGEHPPIDGNHPPIEQAADGDVLFSGTITLAPGAVDGAARGAVVFVSAKDPNSPMPMPVLAKKLPAGPFPMEFALTSADRPPMGAPKALPATFDLTVRVDFDGNAMSKDPAEPIATVRGLAAGSAGLAVTLSVP